MRFPLGSISKAITGTAIFLLWMMLKNNLPEAFKLGLFDLAGLGQSAEFSSDTPADQLHAHPQGSRLDGAPPNSWKFKNKLTINDCLQHRGGFLRTEDGKYSYGWGHEIWPVVLPELQLAEPIPTTNTVSKFSFGPVGANGPTVSFTDFSLAQRRSSCAVLMVCVSFWLSTTTFLPWRTRSETAMTDQMRCN